MAARKPKIIYSWVWKSNQSKPPSPGQKVAGVHGDWKVDWALIGANGEHMCGSNQGFTDKTDARRSVGDVFKALLVMVDTESGALTVREVGPGKKPS